MNYLVAIDNFFPDRPSGSARVAWDIAKVVRDRGHQVHYFCRRQNTDYPDFEEFESVKIYRFDFPKLQSLNPLRPLKQKNATVNAAKSMLSKINLEWDPEQIPKKKDTDEDWGDEDQKIRVFVAKGIFAEGDEYDVNETLSSFSALSDEVEEKLLDIIEDVPS